MAISDSGLDERMVQRLQEELDQTRVKTRKERGETLSYLEAWDVINIANDIFGFDGWEMKILNINVEKDLGVRAVVEVNVHGVVRQDVGFNAFAVAADKPVTKKAMDTSVKGAVSDAMKRSLRTFGPQFGNNLYDKESESRPENQGRQRNRESSNSGSGGDSGGNRQSGGGRQQGNQRQQSGGGGNRRRARGVDTDDSGAEVLTGNALKFKEYVESYQVQWQKFLREILETETLQAYFDSGGTPNGALDAFYQYAEDQGIELK